jgi:hypothetical protein
MDVSLLVRIFAQTYTLFLLNPLFWLVLFLVSIQYNRTIRTEKQVFGSPKFTFWQHALLSALSGLLGGLLASALLVFSGISLVEIGIFYVWPLALLLLLVNPRYLCFAYAGGVVGVVSALLQLLGAFNPIFTSGFLSGLASLNIPGLLALIGILHLTESFLIAISGHLHPSPLFLKTDKGVVGGFSLQKFWPLPLVGLVAAAIPEAAAMTAEAARMPDWWPVFASSTTVHTGQTLMYMMFPIVAGLGYGDLAISSSPRRKSRQSAINLGLYSLILIAIAFLALHYPPAIIPAALFAPIGHELLIIAGNKKEFGRAPLFVPPPEGVMVLDVFPGTAAATAGLQPGDVILAVNGIEAGGYHSFYGLLQVAGPFVSLRVTRSGAEHSLLLRRKGNHNPNAGIILVPGYDAPVLMEVKQLNFFSALAEKLKRFRRV